MAFNNHKILGFGLAGLLATGLSACSEMDDYKQFLPEGEVRYTGRADSVMVYPGKDRILLSWLLISDPNVTRCKVYWDNRRDSVEIDVQKTAGIDTIRLMLGEMEEKTYNFEIYTFDSGGNRSVAVFKTGTVYGDKYQASLLPRAVIQAWHRGDTAYLDWSAAESQSVAVELQYETESGEERKVRIPPSSSATKLPGYKMGSLFNFRTLYLPDSLAIDTFYTDWESLEALYEIERGAWQVAGFSSEESSGEGENNGRALHAFDGNTGTFWHTQWQDAQPGPPHYISADMGSEEDIRGFYFEPRRGSATGNARDIQIALSRNGIDWEDVGAFVLPNDEKRHVVYLASPAKARYFKITVDASHGDQASTFFAEVGAF